ncbi:MAG: thiamine phosphate synthase [Muribaculaceae bacterium]|nr:thiamine phosphate synthase [Muribaculaceae bacterium]
MEADGEFTLIAITPPVPLPNEGARITNLLLHGFDRVHLRHPDESEGTIEEIILGIPTCLRDRISIHDRFELAQRYGLGGVHLNHRNPLPPEGWKGTISHSCHSIEEVVDSLGLDYVTLSPVFDSISKPGYKAVSFGPLPTGIPVIALGGVTPDKIPVLKQLGYSGAAMLSAAW